MATSYNTVEVQGEFTRYEDAAVAALSPGHILEVAATGVQKHSTAAGATGHLVARENDIVGDDILTAYVAGDNVLYTIPNRGSTFLARVAAGAVAIAKGDALESAGDGTVRVQSTSAATSQAQRDSIIGFAQEAVDNSAGASEVFIQVRAN